MGLEKLLDSLKSYLEKGSRKDKAHCDRIDTILEKLEEKEKKLQKKMAVEKSQSKRKKLKMELKILTAQLKKGKKRRDELTAKCKD